MVRGVDVEVFDKKGCEKWVTKFGFAMIPLVIKGLTEAIEIKKKSKS